MKMLVPISITDAMLTSSTVPEPDTGETVWVSGTTYAIGDEVIRTNTHRVYIRKTAGAGTMPPEEDDANWTDLKPTNRWATFDGEISTQSIGDSPLTMVIRPGFFNAMALYGLEGESLTATVKDAPGGTEIFTWEEPLIEPVPDWYEWLFSPIKSRSKVVLKNILPYPDAEVTITITSGAKSKCGLIAIGDLRPVIGSAEWGGTVGGAKAEPVSFSYIKTEFDGTTRIVRRRSATDMTASVAMPRSVADYALSSLQEVLDVPCAWIATDAPGYQGLNVFGLGTGSLSYDSFGQATLNITVKGLV